MQAGSMLVPKTSSVALGGVWAKFAQREEEQQVKIESLEAQASVMASLIQARDQELDFLRNRVEEAAGQLEEQKDLNEDLEVRLGRANHARDSLRAELVEKVTERDAHLSAIAQEKLDLFARCRDLECSHVVALAARDSALKEAEGLGAECRMLADSLSSAEDKLRELTTRSGKLESKLDISERQRDQHMTHSELLLKEKNRLFDQLAHLRKRVAADESDVPEVAAPERSRAPLRAVQLAFGQSAPPLPQTKNVAPRVDTGLKRSPHPRDAAAKEFAGHVEDEISRRQGEEAGEVGGGGEGFTTPVKGGAGAVDPTLPRNAALSPWGSPEAAASPANAAGRTGPGPAAKRGGSPATPLQKMLGRKTKTKRRPASASTLELPPWTPLWSKK